MPDGAPLTRDEAMISCCGPVPLDRAAAARMDAALAERFATELPDGGRRIDFLSPDIHCAACVTRLERAVGAAPGVSAARVNLSLRRIGVEYDPAGTDASRIAAAIADAGYAAKPFDAAALDDFRADRAGRELLSCMAAAGFAAANVMLLSVSVWTGAEDATRDLMHWISALIALPAIVYAGRPFFRSALAALSAGRLNMDVPISLAVILAAGVSLFETAASGPHAYFDAAVTLLFFLLIGRYLDHRVRGLARSAAAELAALSATSATRINPETGAREAAPIEAIAPGDLIEVAAGERLPADGRIASGRSDLDRSLVTGESTPESVGPGDAAHAGMLNLTGPLRIEVTATEERTLLSEISRMIEAAERGANRFTRMADRAARLYAPGVHIVAGLAFLGWMLATGDLRASILIAAALLIITCPCALGLAAPAVQAAAGAALFRSGVLLKDGAALEKLAEIDMVVFDKTGTLTSGAPRLLATDAERAAQETAAALAAASRHPLSRALAAALRADGVDDAAAPLDDVAERPGEGVEARLRADGRRVRLGSAAFCGADPEAAADAPGPVVWLALEGAPPRTFRFEDAPRADAAETVAALQGLGLEVRLLSGDRPASVAAAAAAVGIADARASMSPAQKLAALEALSAEGRRPLMVGDGVNDAPALAAAFVSMSPASAADVSRAGADVVFGGERLAPVTRAIRVARGAKLRAQENIAMATLYNAVAIPIAVAGLVTPFVAAAAMSSSSILVTLNALRARRIPKDGP